MYLVYPEVVPVSWQQTNKTDNFFTVYLQSCLALQSICGMVAYTNICFNTFKLQLVDANMSWEALTGDDTTLYIQL